MTCAVRSAGRRPGSRSRGWRRVRRAGAAAVAVLAAGVALATTFDDERVRCPACEREFTAVHVRSTNTFGGIDADGCVHANGDPPLSFLVDVCPHCLCARLPADRERAPSGEAAARYLEKMAAARPFPEDASPRSIPSRTAYELAAGLLDAEGASPGHRAAVRLRAAWTERGEVRAALLHPEDAWDADVPSEWRRQIGEAWDRSVLLDRTTPGARTAAAREMTAALAGAGATDGDAKGAATAEDAALRRLHAAVVLRVHGELAAAAPDLAALAPDGDAWKQAPPTGVQGAEILNWIAATASAVLAGVEEERGDLTKCVELLGGGGPAGAAPRPWRADWVLSECLRRLGRDEPAAAALARALADPEFPVGALVLLRDAAAVTGDRTPKWKALVETAWSVRVRGLVEALSDAGGAESAARSLARVADRSVLADLVGLAEGENAAVAAAAAVALSGYDDPGAAAVAALEKRVADPAADIDVRSKGIEALVAWAAPSSAPVFRAVLASEDDYLFESAVEGIGLTGAPADVDAVLRVAADAPEAAARALSLLAARPFEHADDFRAWREKNPDSARWTAAAFREAGAAGDGFATEDAVPALLPLLADPRLPVRWNAFRALREITGQSFGARHVLYVGRMPTPRAPEGDVSLELDDVLGRGWTVSHAGVTSFDLDALGAAMQPMRDRDGAHEWSIAEARWRDWWARR